MKLQSLLLVSLASVALAAPSWWEQWTLNKHTTTSDSVINHDDDMRLVQTAADKAPFWTSEKERLSMFRNNIKYMDITDHQDLGANRLSTLGKRRKFMN